MRYALRRLTASPARWAPGRGLAAAGPRLLSSSADTIKTPMYDDHLELGGKLVDFAGYYLPLQYPSGVKAECEATRCKATLFDVSHMGQVSVTGSDRVKFVESLVVADIAALAPGEAKLSVLTNDDGGIIDDTVISKFEDKVGMVINGGCKHKDLAHMHERLAASQLDAHIEHHEGLSLFALQGPAAAAAMSGLVEGVDIEQMLFMGFSQAKVGSIDCMLTRCGYTGEDGFELSVADADAPAMMRLLLAQEGVTPAGLGARDTLRVEAGLCLYGNDIDETTTPVEAGLAWTISPRRRKEGGFPGADVILAPGGKLKKAERKRVGLAITGPPARAQTELFDETKQTSVGSITSGTFSPVLGRPVAMGYVKTGFHKTGTQLFAKVRNKFVPAKVSKMPFVPAGYYRGPQ